LDFHWLLTAIHADQSTTGVGNVSVLLTICEVRVMMTRRDANAGLIIGAARPMRRRLLRRLLLRLLLPKKD
jgi:hypothetical protein